MRPHGNKDLPPKIKDEQISNRLEPRPWRTTQRENRGNYEQRATAGKWASILTAVISYQNKHNGYSPTDLILSRDTGLSPGQVRYHLREMEKGGIITDLKGWPRIILVQNVAKVQAITQLESMPRNVAETETKEAKVMDTSQLDTRKSSMGKSTTGRKPFMVRAREVAQAIVDHYDEYGSPPKVTWVRDRVYRPDGGASGGSASRIITQMTEHGWLHHRPRHRDLTVTGLGRAALFGQLQEQLHTDTPVNPQPKPRSQFKAETPPSPVDPYANWNPPKPPQPTIQWPTPEAPRIATGQGTLSGVPDVDLVIELTSRGFKVSR